YENRGKSHDLGGILNDWLPSDLILLVASYSREPFIPTAKTDFKDIDVWFTSEESKLQTIEDLRNSGAILTIPQDAPVKLLGETYPHFTMTRYRLQWKTLCTFIDLVVSETYPVNDFTF